MAAPIPAIAYRITDGACVIHIAIAPQYPVIGTTNTEFGGDFYRVWENAFDFGAANCACRHHRRKRGATADRDTHAVAAGLALMALLLAALAALAALPRVRARRR